MRAPRPGVTTAELDALAEEHIRDSGAVPVVHGLPRLPGQPVRLGQRRGRARHPRVAGGCATGDVVSIDCGAIVDGWHGDAAVTCRGSATLDPRDGRPAGASARTRCGRGSPPPGSGAGLSDVSARGRVAASAAGGRRSASSRTTSVTASARRCTSRRTCPTTAGPGRGPRLVRGPRARGRADAHARQPADRCSTTTGPWSPPTARRPRTSSTPSPSPTAAPGCSPPLDGGRERLAALGVPSGGAGLSPTEARTA